ncbi:MAG: ATP-binding protein [Bacteroidia bacterium]|nr:ATP-binding protein [Bacteroidia bacterium]
MIIKKIDIKKFRGFDEISFSLGSQLTIIAGQNGTQKTTILGMLSQPFTITDKGNLMKAEKPLCGGSFKSAFSEKFKLSDKFDTVKSHEWALHLHNETNPFVLESIKRGTKIRFWKKGNKGAGSGYIQLPVIYLSLKRLLPIGEDNKLKISSSLNLTEEEDVLYKQWHNKILISQDKLNKSNYLISANKNTVGINTDEYDWKQNSAGQDNLGKILLAILSFRRLKEKYKSDYKGGILAIDELDATFYPASQIKLIKELRKFASSFNIQIILTTHSLSILEFACELQKDLTKHIATKDQIKVLFLEKLNKKVKIINDVTFNTIKHRLNATDEDNKNRSRIDVYTEDKEGVIFTKALLKGKAKNLNFVDCTLPDSSLIELALRKVPTFSFPNSIIILDGDVRTKPKESSKIEKIKNIILLPSKNSPERLLATYLYELDDEDPLWKSINPHYNKQVCFKDFTYEEIMEKREKAKDWFKYHYSTKRWGTNASKVINPWRGTNKLDVDVFINDFTNLYNSIAKELAIDKI